MATAAAGRKTALPVMTVGRMKEATALVEALVAEKTDVFLQASNVYKQKAREASTRDLTPFEAAQVAAAMAEVISKDLSEDPGGAVRRIQESGLKAQDEPEPQEMLMAAGLATAPALMDVALRLVALVEMDSERFKEARESETLGEAIKEDALELEELDLAEARVRAVAALEHVQQASGVTQGKAVGLLVRLIVQAFSQAMAMSRPATSQTESSTSSLVDTTGADSTSSTEPPGELP